MKKIFIFMMSMLFCIMTFAQTPYQTKCFEIYKKYMRIMGAETKTTNQLEEWFNTLALSGVYPIDYEAARTEKTFAAMDLNYSLQFPSKVEDLRSKMKAEFESAKSLMTNEDKKQYQQIVDMRTPYGRAKWQGVADFYKWALKDEYESTTAWEERLNNKSQMVFDSIMVRNVIKVMNENYWTIEYGEYDADEQIQYFYFNDKSRINGCRHEIPMDPQKAKNMKQNNFIDPKSIDIYSDGVVLKSSGNQEVLFYYLFDEICKVEDDDAALIPNIFGIKIGSDKYLFDNTKILAQYGAQINDVTFKCDELGIHIDSLKGYEFSYKKAYPAYKAKVEERRKKIEEEKKKKQEEILKYCY